MVSSPTKGGESQDEYSAARASKFKFKSSNSRSKNDKYGSRKKRRLDEHDEKSHPERRRRHHHHHHRRRRTPSRERIPEEPHSNNNVDPQQAFRESLFDALADDEGAAYWEGVYGQPIHVYQDTKVGPQGELEKMTENEYATYVRGRMYEKTHQHIIEERQRREEEKKRRRRVEEESSKLEEERLAFEDKIQQSLKRGEERKAKQRWKEAWETYITRWEDLRASSFTSDEASQYLRERIPWPVVSGKMKDVSKEEVELFMKKAPSGVELSQLVKGERVKWHPDKMQQKFGGHGIEADVLQSITAVFQVLDDMWGSLRKSNGSG